MYGHVYKLAQKVAEGVEASGCTVKFFQVPETLPEEVLAKMGAPPKPDVPVITAEQMKEADAFLFGLPTRFGSIPAQMRSFLDSTGGLWTAGALVGKPAGVFFSTGAQNGGQETTAYTMVPFFVHQGMPFVPLGYQAGEEMFNMTEVHGASPYGAGTIAGKDGSRQPSELELKVAETQGRTFGAFVARLQ
ncbi:unnamed protein product [Pedinophyceae sp. YPF-701]|nr:unnamed protein product [Pedinophyceae sp. YPF-701]